MEARLPLGKTWFKLPKESFVLSVFRHTVVSSAVGADLQPLTQVRKETVIKTTDSKERDLISCWWNCRLEQLLRKSVRIPKG